MLELEEADLLVFVLVQAIHQQLQVLRVHPQTILRHQLLYLKQANKQGEK